MADAIEPLRLARKGARWVGEVAQNRLPRLNEALAEDAGGPAAVGVSLAFERDAQGRARVRGTLSTTVALQCQRCLEPVRRDLEIDIDMWLVRSDEQARQIAGESIEREPFLLSDTSLEIADLIEDDLLLALPQQVCPDFERCANAPRLSYPSADDDDEAPARGGNPFDVLAELKRRDE